MAALPWAAATVVLLALADAGQSAMARVFTDAYNRFMQKLPLNGGNAMKAEDAFALPPLELGWRQAGLVLRALGSFSVWPFYGALLALLVAAHFQMAAPSAAGVQNAGRDAGAPTVMPQNSATTVVPRQTPFQSPLKPATPPPGVRFPPMPQNRFPATRPPGQSAAPPKAPTAGGTPALQPGPAIPAAPK